MPKLHNAHQLINVAFADVEQALLKEAVVVDQLKSQTKFGLELLPDVVVFGFFRIQLQQDLVPNFLIELLGIGCVLS